MWYHHVSSDIWSHHIFGKTMENPIRVWLFIVPSALWKSSAVRSFCRVCDHPATPKTARGPCSCVPPAGSWTHRHRHRAWHIPEKPRNMPKMSPCNKDYHTNRKMKLSDQSRFFPFCQKVALGCLKYRRFFFKISALEWYQNQPATNTRLTSPFHKYPNRDFAKQQKKTWKRFQKASYAILISPHFNRLLSPLILPLAPPRPQAFAKRSMLKASQWKPASVMNCQQKPNFAFKADPLHIFRQNLWTLWTWESYALIGPEWLVVDFHDFVSIYWDTLSTE